MINKTSTYYSEIGFLADYTPALAKIGCFSEVESWEDKFYLMEGLVKTRTVWHLWIN